MQSVYSASPADWANAVSLFWEWGLTPLQRVQSVYSNPHRQDRKKGSRNQRDVKIEGERKNEKKRRKAEKKRMIEKRKERRKERKEKQRKKRD